MTEPGTSGLARLVTQPAVLAGEEDLHVVYLRHKPSRGLIALHAGRRRAERMACVSVDESVLREGDVGVRATVSWFPDDPELRVLAVCFKPSADRALWSALERAARGASGLEGRLAEARAEPLRYKPHDRCLLRYRLVFDCGSGAPVELGVIAKAYYRRDQARRVQTVAEQLHRRGACAVARPLGGVDTLGVVLSEDVSASSCVSGTLALRPKGGGALPDRELKEAAMALAALHACSPAPDCCAPRSVSRDAATALERCELLARSAPSLAPRLRSAGGLLGDALRSMRGGDRCLVHGSFKPSQLLFGAGGRVVVTDLDSVCVADPALDVGYFLAYLRPAALWQGSVRARAWFKAAAERFRDAYATAAGSATAREDVEHALARASTYEAATLLKIASRRIRRLNSPRPRELAAILEEVSICLGAPAERMP
jgi:Phosphotransferase enzyme family